ncbi:MAG: hypothetical protein L7T24_07415, partial [Luminiphilus sp.]|nr:hypothetical protein [Luminiphilus sp.]
MAEPIRAGGADAPAVYLACISCHGEDGWGSPAVRAPAIAGQPSVYLKKQLLDYRSGLRGTQSGDRWGSQMALMAQPLSDGDVAQLALILAEQSLWPGATPNENPAPEAALPCLACHSKNRAGWASSTVPILWGLSSDYLFRQLVAYRQGGRGGLVQGEAADPMAGVVNASLSDDVLMDIARYFANE